MTRHADVRRVLSDSRRFSIVLPPDYSRRLADEDMSDEDACMESGTKWGRLRGERRLRVGSASMAAYAQMGQFCTLGGSGERPVTVGGTAASNHQGRG